MVNNSAFRGDNISVIDLVPYGSGINSVTSQAGGKDTSYAATYWPWLQTIDPDLGSLVWVPASTMMPGVYAFNDRAGEAWFAPAGLNRGGLGTVVRAERKLTNGNRDDLYQDNVNPIATFPNTGVVVFGQKTMQKKASALDRVNVRRLLIELKGYILKPEHARKTRGEQYFFVNDRFFKSSYFNHAITKAFDGLIKNGLFPGYFLYLTVDPQKIDVNVHPTKTEIKFEEDKFIYAIIVSSIRQALGKYNIAPTLDFEPENSFEIPHSMRSQTPIEPTVRVNENYNPFSSNAIAIFIS